jgi:hypothetical protein
MNDQLVNELLERLDAAGELAVEGFGVLLRQVYITAAFNVLWGVLCLVAVATCVWMLRKLGCFGGTQEWCTGHYDEPEMAMFFAGVAGLSFLGLSTAFFQAAVSRFINPEFYAIDYLLKGLG